MQAWVFGDPPWDQLLAEGMSDKDSYVAALYWAGMTLTTIGYGDVFPRSAAQRVYVSCVMLVGGFLYGYIIGAVSALLSAAGERRHHFFRTMTKLNVFLDNRHIPTQLRYKLREYFRCGLLADSAPHQHDVSYHATSATPPPVASRYKYTFASNLDGIRELLDTMSPALRQEVSQHTCRVLTTEVPYFKNCDVSFLMECAVRMEEVVYAPMELAIVEGKPLSHLIIIRKGVMVARGRVLTKGRVVGQESLYKEAPASTSVRSMTFTDASQLARGTLLDILRGYPELLRSFALKSIQVVFKCARSVSRVCVVSSSPLAVRQATSPCAASC